MAPPTRPPLFSCSSGGLTDGFFAVPYLAPLASALDAVGFTLIHALLRSSHAAWGFGSLDRDAEDLERLLHALGAAGSAGVVLIGHSTGCQDAVRLAQRLKEADVADADAAAAGSGAPTPRAGSRPPILGAVLQAPVSDREWLALDPETPRRVAAAATAVNKDLPELVVTWMRAWDGAPVTAARFLALAARGGDDDLFSTGDATDSELVRALAPLAGVPTLVLVSEKDEYVAPDHDPITHADRLANAVVPRGCGEAAIVAAAHSGDGAVGDVVAKIVDFIERRCAPR